MYSIVSHCAFLSFNNYFSLTYHFHLFFISSCGEEDAESRRVPILWRYGHDGRTRSTKQNRTIATKADFHGAVKYQLLHNNCRLHNCTMMRFSRKVQVHGISEFVSYRSIGLWWSPSKRTCLKKFGFPFLEVTWV